MHQQWYRNGRYIFLTKPCSGDSTVTKTCIQGLSLRVYHIPRIRRVRTNIALLTSLWKVGNFYYLPCSKGSRQELLKLPGTTYLAASSGTSKKSCNCTSQHNVMCRNVTSTMLDEIVYNCDIIVQTERRWTIWQFWQIPFWYFCNGC